MSRLSTMSPGAVKEILSPESGDDFIVLLTIYDPDDETTVIARICDNFTQRLTTPVIIGDSSTGGPISYSTNDQDIVYGVVSRGENYIFLPVEVTLPDESENRAPRASLILHDITQYLTPLIRTIVGPPKIKLEIVLASDVDTPEIVFTDFFIYSITYTRDSITAELSMVNYDLEPFPQHSFIPAYFPGIF